jgi:hypothetical protein
VVEASKQCGRNRLMQIASAQDWPAYVAGAPTDAARLIAHPQTAPGELRLPATGPIYLAVGPEGGFSDDEVELARSSGWQAVDLGPRILRVETAGLWLAAKVVSSFEFRVPSSEFLTMPRFVILEHEMPPDAGRPTHWDFMLEAGDVLWTWALPESPSLGQTLDAQRLADHRPEYLDYEGAVSAGRGAVTRWDQGTFEIERQNAGELVVSLRGGKISGRACLTRDQQNTQRWRLLVEPAT